jgi:hypothetical protein
MNSYRVFRSASRLRNTVDKDALTHIEAQQIRGNLVDQFVGAVREISSGLWKVITSSAATGRDAGLQRVMMPAMDPLLHGGPPGPLSVANLASAKKAKQRRSSPDTKDNPRKIGTLLPLQRTICDGTEVGLQPLFCGW